MPFSLFFRKIPLVIEDPLGRSLDLGQMGLNFFAPPTEWVLLPNGGQKCNVNLWNTTAGRDTGHLYSLDMRITMTDGNPFPKQEFNECVVM